MDAMRKIETNALINSGVPENYAINAVEKAITDLTKNGITPLYNFLKEMPHETL